MKRGVRRRAESGAMYNSRVSSPQSNGIAERFVNDEGRLYRVHAETGCENSLQKPCSGVHALNENHPHSALGYHSLEENTGGSGHR